MEQTLLIHWKPEKNKSFDSMRLSANLERFEKPVIFFLDEANPFLKPSFFVLINALSVKKLTQFRFVVDFSAYENELWRKQLQRALMMLKGKGLPFLLCERAHPGLFAKPLEASRFYKKELRDQGASFSFVPYEGEYEGRVFPQDYTEDEILYFELRSEALVSCTTSDLDKDSYELPLERQERVRKVKEFLLSGGRDGR